MRIPSSVSLIVGVALLGLAGPLGLLAPAARAHEPVDARNRASFQVEAVREVANDWATARLSVVAEGKDPAAVAATVNRRMKSALDTARGTKGVEVRSGAYQTQPVHDDGRIVRWRASQDLRLESEDVDLLSKLIGGLQGESVLLSEIRFSVKRETRRALEDELIGEALAAFRSRASLVARGMGAKTWSLVNVSIGDSGSPRPRVQMRAESAIYSKAAAPAFEAGTSEVRIRVDGQVELD